MIDDPVKHSRAASRTSSSLLRAVRADESAAWRQLVTEYAPVVYRWARQAVLGPEDAADITQEVLGAVVSKLSEFRHDRPGDTFQGWLQRITQNQIRDYWRRQNRRPVELTGGTDHQRDVTAIPEPSSRVFVPTGEPSAEFKRVIASVRARCTGNKWDVFLWYTIDDIDPAIVAEEFGIKVSAVYVIKSRVLKLFREAMAEQRPIPSPEP